jgi:hypothetical protein
MGPASVVVVHWDSAVDRKQSRNRPLPLEESGRGQVKAEEDSKEDEMELTSEEL